MPIADTPMPPPRKAGPGRPRTAKGPTMEDMKAQKYESTLSDIKDLGAALLSLGGLDADAGAVHVHLTPAVPELAKLAPQFDWATSFLDNWDKVGGKYMQLAFLVIPLGLQIAANHNLVHMAPGGMFNTMPPELLRAQIMQQKAQKVQEAREAMAEAQAAAERINAELQQAEAPAA